MCYCTKSGVLPLECGIGGINVFNKPTKCFIANPILGSFDRTINDDCVLVYFWNIFGQYSNVNSIITRYASILRVLTGLSM